MEDRAPYAFNQQIKNKLAEITIRKGRVGLCVECEGDLYYCRTFRDLIEVLDCIIQEERPSVEGSMVKEVILVGGQLS
jgi:hypothetical protein